MKKRVVITGLGLLTPLGNSVKENWDSLMQGKSGIDKITRFDTTQFSTQIAGEVKNFDPATFIDKKDIKKMDTFIHYALYASIGAVDDSGIKIGAENAHRTGVLIGVGLGGLQAIEKNYQVYLESGPRRVTPFFIPMVIPNLASGQVSIRIGAKGPSYCPVSACASGAHAIGEAVRIIQRGDADIMVAGGAESTICPLCVAGFSSMKALSSVRNSEPQKASRPFERDRDGFVVGEGAGVMVLEDLENAQKRGAKIYAEFAGYGLSSDAYHLTMPDPEGEGMCRSMEMALQDNNLKPEEVDYINAHGTSTPFNDKFETMSIKKVFKEHAYKLAISSTKSMIGHLLGAAGGVEAIYSVLSIKNGEIPPTINHENPDPELDLDFVPNYSRKKDINVALSNSFGFGGTNATLVFRRYQD